MDFLSAEVFLLVLEYALPRSDGQKATHWELHDGSDDDFDTEELIEGSDDDFDMEELIDGSDDDFDMEELIEGLLRDDGNRDESDEIQDTGTLGPGIVNEFHRVNNDDWLSNGDGSTTAGAHTIPSDEEYLERRSNRELQTHNKSTMAIHQSHVQRSMSWVASLRLVNHSWRAFLDSDNVPVWFHVANYLGLDPPWQLYAGGNYLIVCKSLLRAENQKTEMQRKAAVRKDLGARVACGLRIAPAKPREHPHPERPFVRLPTEVMDCIASNTKALEEFLRSVDFDLLVNDRDRLQWAQSALNRYRMFLQLKQANPNLWLMPTVEIEFCWLAHIFRTENYWNDMKALDIDPHHSLASHMARWLPFLRP
jgi:hypothetical protein